MTDEEINEALSTLSNKSLELFTEHPDADDEQLYDWVAEWIYDNPHIQRALLLKQARDENLPPRIRDELKKMAFEGWGTRSFKGK